MRVAYSGTRRPREGAPAVELALYERIEEDAVADVMQLPAGTVVVHGDEPTGIDRAVRDAACELGLVEEAHPPDLAAHGGNFARAATARNIYVTTVDEARFFASPQSRGTWDAWRKAERARIPRVLRDYLSDGGVRVLRWPPVPAPRLRVRSGSVRGYSGPGALDVTRGSGRGLALAFAPTRTILEPALAERDRAAPLFTRANQFLTGRVLFDDARRAEVATLTAEARAIEDASWAIYRPQFVAEMRVTAGLARGGPRWGALEEEAWSRGVRPMVEAWRALFAGKLGSYDTDGVPLVVATCWCSLEHRKRGMCHARVLCELWALMGAEDGGEAIGPGFGIVCSR